MSPFLRFYRSMLIAGPSKKNVMTIRSKSVGLLRLRGLLRDAVRKEGRTKTADRLRVNQITVARTPESCKVTPSLSEALECS